MPDGKHIVLEGIDGSGTTIQSEMLGDALEKLDVPYYRTAEPSAGAIGKLLREILGGRTYTYLNRMHPEKLKTIMALLFTADRADHVWTELEPKWKEGKVTICDRYVLSTFAYQLGVLTDRSWIEEIGRSLPKPDLTIYLRIEAEKAFARLEKRWSEKGGASPEIYEKLEVQKKLVHHYDAFCGCLYENESFVEKHNIHVVDASQEIEKVCADVFTVVSNHLRKWGLVV